MKTRVIDRKAIYKGKIFDVVEDTIEFEDGSITKWDLVVHPGACAIVPITDDNEVILVRQYRNAEDGEVLEIPAGKLEKGEDPENCAIRELEEETGYKAKVFEKICTTYSAIGFSNEKLHIYKATKLIKGIQKLDHDEYIKIEKYPVDRAVEMIFEGIIKDSKSIIGILAVKHMLEK